MASFHFGSLCHCENLKENNLRLWALCSLTLKMDEWFSSFPFLVWWQGPPSTQGSGAVRVAVQFAQHSEVSSIFLTFCNWWYSSQSTQFQNQFLWPNSNLSILHVLFHYSSFYFFSFTRDSALNTTLFLKEWEVSLGNYLNTFSGFICQRYSNEERIVALFFGFPIHFCYCKQCIFNYEATKKARQ